MDIDGEWYADITEEEEAGLPLPDGWISLIKIPLPTGGGGEQKPIRTYKNVRLGTESVEHPFIIQAQMRAKKLIPAPSWSAKAITQQDGSTDIFYHHAECDFSMWDHPLLRQELSDLLTKSGHNPINFGIKKEKKKIVVQSLPAAQVPSGSTAHVPRSQASHDESTRFSATVQLPASPDPVSYSNRSAPSQGSVAISELDKSMHSALSDSASTSSGMDQLSSTHSTPAPSERNPQSDELLSKLYLDDLGTVHDEGISTHVPQGPESTPGDANFSPQHDIADVSVQSESVVDNRRDWESLLNTYKDPGTELDKISHRVKHIKPPVTVSGIRVLREDVMEANERVHHLLMRLRTILSAKSGIECTLLYHQQAAGAMGNTAAAQNNVTLASDIITTLRQRPEYVVLAMANSNNVRDGSSVMVQIAFTVLQRLLHPFSADSSMTTAILLQGINYQLDELTAVEQVFSELDSKVIIARALFVTDPDTAVTWDPLLAPLPTVPESKSETVLACLLRVYAIRRDVTSYFRTIWRPVLPGVVALLKQHGEQSKEPAHGHHNQEHMFTNTIAVAYRLLECTLSDKSILVFPPIATAVCRAVHEIGGQLALHTYLFQLLILPNLLKVLAGDHESSENEDIYRVDNVDEIVNKYYDNGFWFKKSGVVESEEVEAEPGILDPLRTLIWVVWRLYTCAVFMSDTAVTALGMGEFLSASTPIALDQHAYAYPAMRLRNMLMRLRRKIDRGCAFLLTMPMDAQGSEYLGVSEDDEEGALGSQIQRLESPTEMAQLLDRRVHALHFKPNEMLNLTIASQYEIGALFSDVALAMEMHDQANKNPIYQAIAEYLNHNMDFDSEEAREQLMELSFLYVSDDFSGYGADPSNGMPESKVSYETSELVASRYDQLLRGLRLSNRYEDSLVKMITRIQANRISSVFELVEDETWFHAPEFDASVKNDAVKIAKKHTAGSVSKKKSAHFGLARAANVPVFPLFSQHNPHDHHPNHKSLVQLQQDIIKSYRFHTPAACANAGTSLAGPKVIAPKIHPSSINVTTTDAKGTALTRNRSRYTKIEINPKAGILAPTKNIINQKVPQQDNIQQKHGKFLGSLRDHGIIPTDEFQARYRKVVLERRRHKQQLLEQQLAGGRASGEPQQYQYAAVGGSAAGGDNRVRQPFPEHLRNRQYGHLAQEQGVRDDPRSSYDSTASRGSNQRSRSSSPGMRGRSRGYPGAASGSLYGRGQYYEVNGEVPESPQSLAQEIIRDYSNLFAAPPQPERDSISGRPQFMHAARESHHRPVSPSGSQAGSRRTGTRSPGLPEPIPGSQTQFLSPTRALLNRLTDNSEQELKKATEWRRYDRTTDFEVEEPFSPTAKKIYPPMGLRVPRVPEFLVNDGISDSARTASIASSRSLSRTNSFSSSPVRGRSRENSFSNLTHICKRQPESEEEEYLPISEPTTPTQVPMPNTVNIDLSLAREAERRAAQSATQAAVWQSVVQNHAHATAQSTAQSFPEPPPAPTGSSLQKFKKVSLVQPESGAVSMAPAYAPTASVSPAIPESGPRVITLSAPSKWNLARELEARAAVQQVPAAAPVVPTVEVPSLVIQSSVAQPLAAPAMMAAELPRQRFTEVPAATLIVPASDTISYKAAVPVSVPPPTPAPAPVSVPVHVLAASLPVMAPQPIASKPPVQDAPAVGFKYSLKFAARSEYVSGEGEGEGGEGGEPSHVYDVNAAYEEAYLAAKARMHLGDAEDDDHSGESDFDEDGVPRLTYPQASTTNRNSFRSSLMSKQKSMSRRASKVLLDDEQVVGFMTTGFQAIKHGRSGKSKAKIVKYNRAARVFEWEALSNDRLKMVKSFFRRGSFSEPILGVDENAPCISVDSIKTVYTGIRTDIMLRAGQLDPACCVSIITDTRSLDLTLANATERDRLVRGLKIILESKGVPFL